MLYDKRWDKPEIKTEPLSLEGFVEWLETQRPSKQYDWTDTCGCIAHQYLTFHGIRGGTILSSVFPSVEIYWDVCATKPHTFGAALTRAREALASR